MGSFSDSDLNYLVTLILPSFDDIGTSEKREKKTWT